MSDEERTAGGLVGKVAGKAKELAGEVTGDQDLAGEGRLQQSAVDAQARANEEIAAARRSDETADIAAQREHAQEEKRRLEAEQLADQREQDIDDDARARRKDADAEAAQDKQAAAAQRAAGEQAAARQESRTEQEQAAAEQDADQLARAAAAAERAADEADPDRGA